MKNVSLEFLLDFFRLTDAWEIDRELFWWRTDGEYAPVTIFANCNDLFWWACADAEEVTPENIGALRKALEDIAPLVKAGDDAIEEKKARGEKQIFSSDPPMISKSMAVLLFCARARGMRPQGAYYDAFPPPLAALFDAAGPPRGGKDDTTRREWKPQDMVFPQNETQEPPWKCRSCRAVETGGET